MLCEYRKCKKEADFVCKTCNKSTLYCNSHRKTHLNSNQAHSLELIKPSEIHTMVQTWKKSEINKNKHLIIDEAQRIISQVLDTTRLKIIQLKKSNINIKKIIDFKPIHFDAQIVSEIIHMITLLSEDENYLSEEKRLLKEVENKNIEINKLYEIIKNLENNLNKKNKIISQNQSEINRLTIYSEKRNKLLVNTESQLQKAEKDLKELNLVKSKEMESLIQENENLKVMLNETQAKQIKVIEENNIKSQDNNTVKNLQETNNKNPINS